MEGLVKTGLNITSDDRLIVARSGAFGRSMGKEEDADQDREDQKRGRSITAQLEAMLTREAVELLPLDLTDIPRMREHLQKYADRPMNL